MKLRKSVILYNQFLALKYRLPNIIYPEIPYTQKPWPTLCFLYPSYRIHKIYIIYTRLHNITLGIPDSHSFSHFFDKNFGISLF